MTAEYSLRDDDIARSRARLGPCAFSALAYTYNGYLSSLNIQAICVPRSCTLSMCVKDVQRIDNRESMPSQSVWPLCA